MFVVVGFLLLTQSTNAFLEQPSKGYFSDQIQAGQKYQWEILDYQIPSEDLQKYNTTFLEGLEKGKTLTLEVIKDPADLNSESKQVQISEYFSASIDGNPFSLGEENIPSIWFVYYESSSITVTLSAWLISPLMLEFQNGSKITLIEYTKLQSAEYAIGVSITEDERTYTIDIPALSTKYTIEKETGVLEYFLSTYFSDFVFEMQRISDTGKASFLAFGSSAFLIFGLGSIAVPVLLRRKLTT